MMYKHGIILITLILTSCLSVRLTESWRNPEYSEFSPERILVVGVTSDFEARVAFEIQLMTELNARKINALQSHVVFETSFQDSKQTEEEIREQVDLLLSKGYDTILVSLVKGVEDNQSYSSESPKTDYHFRRFTPYYLLYQEAYFKQDYYNKYKVFHIETSMYSLKNDLGKTLVWSATYDLVDLNDITKNINSYVKTVIKSLEKENLVSKIK